MSFHVPEFARVLPHEHPLLGSTILAGNNGAFELKSPDAGWTLYIICSDEDGWEHVSVHSESTGRARIPNWKEMCYVKDLCWDGEDVVIQYHPAKSEYVNTHQYTLHLWRPIGVTLPIPNKEFV